MFITSSCRDDGDWQSDETFLSNEVKYRLLVSQNEIAVKILDRFRTASIFSSLSTDNRLSIINLYLVKPPSDTLLCYSAHPSNLSLHPIFAQYIHI